MLWITVTIIGVGVVLLNASKILYICEVFTQGVFEKTLLKCDGDMDVNVTEPKTEVQKLLYSGS